MATVLAVIGQEAVIVDDDVASQSSGYVWQRMGGRIIRTDDYGFGRMADLGELVGGPGAFAATPNDYRRQNLLYIELDDDCRASVRRLMERKT